VSGAPRHLSPQQAQWEHDAQRLREQLRQRELALHAPPHMQFALGASGGDGGGGVPYAAQLQQQNEQLALPSPAYMHEQASIMPPPAYMREQAVSVAPQRRADLERLSLMSPHVVAVACVDLIVFIVGLIAAYAPYSGFLRVPGSSGRLVFSFGLTGGIVQSASASTRDEFFYDSTGVSGFYQGYDEARFDAIAVTLALIAANVAVWVLAVGGAVQALLVHREIRRKVTWIRRGMRRADCCIQADHVECSAGCCCCDGCPDQCDNGPESACCGPWASFANARVMLYWQVSLLVCWLVTIAAGMVPCTWVGAPIELGAGFVCACICFVLAGITSLLAALVLEGFLLAATEMPPAGMLASLPPGAPPPSMALADVAVGGLSTTSHLGGPLSSLPGLYGAPRGGVLPMDPLAAAVFGLAHPEHAQDPRVLAAMQDAAARGVIGFSPQHHGGLVVRQMAQPAQLQGGGQGGWAAEGLGSSRQAQQMQIQQQAQQMQLQQQMQQMQQQMQQQQMLLEQQQQALAAAQQRQAWEMQPPASQAVATGLSPTQEAELAARRRMASGEPASAGGGSLRRADIVAASSILTAQQQELLRLRMNAAMVSFGSADAALPGAAAEPGAAGAGAAGRPRLGFAPSPASSAQPLAPSALLAPPPLPPALRGGNVGNNV
jgi:hypothetical protein